MPRSHINASGLRSYSAENEHRSSPGEWLTDEEQKAWQAYMRLQMLINHEIDRQLQADRGLSADDYEVLHALSQAPEGCLRVNALANMLAWEHSRLSRQTERMADRGLVVRNILPTNHRVTEVCITGAGRDTLAAAAPGHVDLVRRLFFDGIPDGFLEPLAEALDVIRLNASRVQLKHSPPAPEPNGSSETDLSDRPA